MREVWKMAAKTLALKMRIMEAWTMGAKRGLTKMWMLGMERGKVQQGAAAKGPEQCQLALMPQPRSRGKKVWKPGLELYICITLCFANSLLVSTRFPAETGLVTRQQAKKNAASKKKID
jgi:hypothetical protein